jgi:hypothetical protein
MTPTSLEFRSYIGNVQVGTIPPGSKYRVWVNNYKTGIICSEPNGDRGFDDWHPRYEKDGMWILLHEIASYLKVEPNSISEIFADAWNKRGGGST